MSFNVPAGSYNTGIGSHIKLFFTSGLKNTSLDNIRQKIKRDSDAAPLRAAPAL